jgi:hypothetical protein
MGINMGGEYGDMIRAEQDREKILVQGLEEYEGHLDIKMLLHNKITGVLPLQVRYVDDRVLYCYGCDDMLPLEQILADGQWDLAMAHCLVEAICRWHHLAREYFLKEDHFVLHPSYLMWHPGEEEFYACYYPGWELALLCQMETLWEELLPKINHEDKQCVSFCYGIYDVLGQSKAAIGELERFLQKDCRGSGLNQQSGEKDNVDSYTSAPQYSRGCYLEKISPCPGAPEKISLNQNSVLIGRQEGTGNIPGRQISRNHAVLEWENGQLFLTDTNSGNGVFLNGKRLLREHGVLCREGDKITFADISYRVSKEASCENK